MSEWTDGSPPYSNEDGSYYCWLLMEDQGGWPFMALGFVYGQFTEDFAERQALWMEWMRGGKKGERPLDATIEGWIKIPSLNVDKKVDSIWNISKWKPIERPEDPRLSKNKFGDIGKGEQIEEGSEKD